MEEAYSLRSRSAGLEAAIVVDSTARGPAFGGVRIAPYRDSEAMVDDACRLARSMALKTALAGLPVGGGKIVIRDQEGLDRLEAIRILALWLDARAGSFFAGPDYGLTGEDLDRLSGATPHAAGPSIGSARELGEATARGVLEGIRAGVEVALGSVSLAGRTVLVQGVGSVGGPLIGSLLREGATVLAADPDPARLEGLGEVDRVGPDTILDRPGDVLCPCARGGWLGVTEARTVRARVVAGGANNILASDEAGRILHRREVVFVPDLAINAGAVIRGVCHHLGRPGEVDRRIGAIGETARLVLAESRESGDPPHEVAVRLARRRL